MIHKVKLNVEEYTLDDAKRLMENRADCSECKFCQTWKGKKFNSATFPRQLVYRLYCSINHEHDTTLPTPFKLGDLWLKWKTVGGLLSWIPSVLHVKELDKCPVDLAKRNQFLKKANLEEEKLLQEWKGKRTTYSIPKY
jgi:hypothetical protein